MELGDQRESGNVEDRRGMGIGVGGGLGIGGIVIALVAAYFGVDPSTVLDTVQQVQTQADTREAPRGTPTDEMGRFVSKVLGSTEDVWGQIFSRSGKTYTPPTLVLYSGAVRSACGLG
ncbi:MAG TPA: neutral zinc metallopeptidase, partial [Usitatibacter sp.]